MSRDGSWHRRGFGAPVACAALVFLAGARQADGAPIHREQARKAAVAYVERNYAVSGVGVAQGRLSVTAALSVAAVEALRHREGTVGYHVRLQPAGFVLIRSDDLLPPIKAHSAEGSFDLLPPGLRHVLLTELAQEHASLEAAGKAGARLATHEEAWAALLGASTVLATATSNQTAVAGIAILSTSWDQDEPYNYYAPSASGGPGGRAYAGCTATALAQILRHHQKPTGLLRDASYTDLIGTCTGTRTASSAGMGDYAWGSMPTSISTSSSLAQKQAVGQLIYHCGVVLESDFEYNGTSAFPSDVRNILAPYFGYTFSGYMEKTSGIPSGWYSSLASDIDAGRPVFYAMWESDNGINASSGHAVVCDGYRNGNEIHLNMGWSGSGNAWYNIQSVNYGDYAWTWHYALLGVTPGASVTNDAFADAIAISGISGTVSGNNLNATKETGEPNHYSSGGASVWWKWTAPATASVTFDTVGSVFDTLMAAYRGTAVSALTKLAENDDDGGNLTSRIVFTATNGVVYYIAVDGFSGATGAITLNWQQNVSTPSAPLGLTAANGASTASVALSWSATSGATTYEVWRHTSNNSASASKIADPTSASHSDASATPGTLYYYWVKAKNVAGTSAFSASVSGYRALSGPGGVAATDADAAKIRVSWSTVTGASHYRVSRATSVGGTKSDLGSWQTATFYDDASAQTGVPYYYWIRAAVDSSGSRVSAYSAYDTGYRPLAGPPNDNFVAAIALSGSSGQAPGDSRSATKETGEPNHHGDASATASVWWTWTSPITGQVVFDTAGSSFDTILAVYTGTSVGALTWIASNDDAIGTASRVAFGATGGSTYRIALAGYGCTSGDIVLNWAFFMMDGPTIVSAERIFSSGQPYFRVQFKGQAGVSYAVQMATALSASTLWQELSPPVTKYATSSGIQTLDIPIAGASSGFFRIMQE